MKYKRIFCVSTMGMPGCHVNGAATRSRIGRCQIKPLWIRQRYESLSSHPGKSDVYRVAEERLKIYPECWEYVRRDKIPPQGPSPRRSAALRIRYCKSRFAEISRRTVKAEHRISEREEERSFCEIGWWRRTLFQALSAQTAILLGSEFGSKATPDWVVGKVNLANGALSDA